MYQLLPLFLALALSSGCFLAVNAQDNDGEASRTALQMIDTVAVPIALCRMVPTCTFLGYKPGTNTAVYQNDCSGLCLSFKSQGTYCAKTTSKVMVTTLPYSYSAPHTVEVITQCSCAPRPCSVINPETGIATSYPHGATVYNSCKDKCSCSYGRLINCCRQRREFRLGMSNADKKLYIDTLKIASTTAPYKTVYDALINKHQSNFFSGIHGLPYFFPWHRAYILELEELLRQIDCRVTVPYWDWSRSGVTPLTSSIWGSANYQLGATGSPCVTTGPFAFPGWTLPSGGCLQRSFSSGSFATAADIQQYMTLYATPTPANYSSFSASIESGPGLHGAVHCAIGGTMCTTAASAAPEFFLHHAMIDKTWADWQKKSPLHVNAFSGSLSATMPAMNGQSASAVMDLKHQITATGKDVCVEYIAPRSIFEWLDVVIASVSLRSLISIPRVPVLSSVPWGRIMQMNEKELALMQKETDIRNGEGDMFNIISVNDALAEASATSVLGIRLSEEQLSVIAGDLELSDTSEFLMEDSVVDVRTPAGLTAVLPKVCPRSVSLQLPTSPAADALPAPTPAAATTTTPNNKTVRP